jgi:hypothetical protein
MLVLAVIFAVILAIGVYNRIQALRQRRKSAFTVSTRFGTRS